METEIVFTVKESEDGGYEAGALSHVRMQGGTL